MSKNKLKLYFTTGSTRTMFRVNPLQHINLHKFLTDNWANITTEYQKIPKESIQKGIVVSLQFKKEDFLIVQKEIRSTAESITIWQTSKQPIVSMRIEKVKKIVLEVKSPVVDLGIIEAVTETKEE